MWLFGRAAYALLAMIQVTVVLLAAPVAAADAFSRDRPRGPLSHLLVTDLSAFEIVIGTAAARLVPVIMLLMAAVPVAMLEVVEFGVDPELVLALTMVSLGLALLGVAVSAALSLWSRRSYEALLGVYLHSGSCIVVVALLVFVEVRPPPAPGLVDEEPSLRGGRFLEEIFWPGLQAVTLPHRRRGVTWASQPLPGGFDPGSDGLGLRAVASREPRPRREPALGARRGVIGRLPEASSSNGLVWLPGPSLDGNPVLWREWWYARQSRWLGAYWGIYVLGLTAETAIALVEFVSGHYTRPALIPLCLVRDGVRSAGGGGPFGGGVVGGTGGRSGRARRVAVHATVSR